MRLKPAQILRSAEISLSTSPRYDPALTGVRDIMALVTSLGFTPGLVTAEEGLEA